MRLLLLIAALTLPAPATTAQTTADLVQQAIANAKSSKTSQNRFTRFDLEHNQNRNEKGKLFADRLSLYEDTYIAGLPYKRLVEVDNKPLTGNDLAKEKERYDEAVAQRKGLDLQARATFLHEKLVDGGIDLDQVLSPNYTLTEFRQETLPQPSGPPILTHVIDAKPTAGATKHYTLWIADTTPAILRMTFDVIADEPNMLHGSHGQSDFQLIEGIAVPTHLVIHFFYPYNGRTITVDVDHLYTRYRRFNTSARIIEEATQPPDTP